MPGPSQNPCPFFPLGVFGGRFFPTHRGTHTRIFSLFILAVGYAPFLSVIKVGYGVTLGPYPIWLFRFLFFY